MFQPSEALADSWYFQNEGYVMSVSYGCNGEHMGIGRQGKSFYGKGDRAEDWKSLPRTWAAVYPWMAKR